MEAVCAIQEGEVMKRWHIIASTLPLFLSAGCATRAPDQREQSIVEVLNTAEAQSTPRPEPGAACPFGEVNYCYMEANGKSQCGCLNSAEVQRRLGPGFVR
jgi:hypothetical protein